MGDVRSASNTILVALGDVGLVGIVEPVENDGQYMQCRKIIEDALMQEGGGRRGERRDVEEAKSRREMKDGGSEYRDGQQGSTYCSFTILSLFADSGMMATDVSSCRELLMP